jgi:multisubunit Na+/H+ antiporter MnhG subunit
VAAHKIGRAGYRRGVPLYEGTICDEAKERLDVDDRR